MPSASTARRRRYPARPPAEPTRTAASGTPHPGVLRFFPARQRRRRPSRPRPAGPGPLLQLESHAHVGAKRARAYLSNALLAPSSRRIHRGAAQEHPRRETDIGALLMMRERANQQRRSADIEAQLKREIRRCGRRACCGRSAFTSTTRSKTPSPFSRGRSSPDSGRQRSWRNCSV